mmetsp:Transcript_6755/g.10997  ORF Transcript_6755/g.10997 Transcript_6755/m.10997 type:complete len:231 (-) Transcript_6755:1949-2641(-)
MSTGNILRHFVNVSLTFATQSTVISSAGGRRSFTTSDRKRSLSDGLSGPNGSIGEYGPSFLRFSFGKPALLLSSLFSSTLMTRATAANIRQYPCRLLNAPSDATICFFLWRVDFLARGLPSTSSKCVSFNHSSTSFMETFESYSLVALAYLRKITGIDQPASSRTILTESLSNVFKIGQRYSLTNDASYNTIKSGITLATASRCLQLSTPGLLALRIFAAPRTSSPMIVE